MSEILTAHYKRGYLGPTNLNRQSVSWTRDWERMEYDHKQKRPTDGDKYAEWREAQKQGRILFRPHWVKSESRIENGFNASVSVSVKRGPEDPVEMWKNTCVNAPVDLRKIPTFESDHKFDRPELVTLALAEANRRELDLLTVIGEMPETIRMLAEWVHRARHPIQTLQSIGSELKRWGRDPKRAVDASTRFWMEYRYGWMPAVYTYQDIMAQFNRQVKEFQTSRKSDTSEIDEAGIARGSIEYSNFIDYDLTWSVRIFSHRVAMIKRCFSMAELSAKRIALNPFATGWELTSLSWAVDWYLHVGDSIMALTPTSSTQQASCYAQRYKHIIEAYATPRVPPPDVYWMSGSPSGGTQMVLFDHVNSYNRDVVEDASAEFTVPVGLKMNLKRQLDAFSLLWGKTRTATLRRQRSLQAAQKAEWRQRRRSLSGDTRRNRRS